MIRIRQIKKAVIFHAALRGLYMLRPFSSSVTPANAGGQARPSSQSHPLLMLDYPHGNVIAVRWPIMNL